MSIKVFEGERPMYGDNYKLGEFVLKNLPPGPSESVKVNVTFAIDVNGILKVTAREVTTGVQ